MKNQIITFQLALPWICMQLLNEVSHVPIRRVESSLVCGEHKNLLTYPYVYKYGSVSNSVAWDSILSFSLPWNCFKASPSLTFLDANSLSNTNFSTKKNRESYSPVWWLLRIRQTLRVYFDLNLMENVRDIRGRHNLKGVVLKTNHYLGTYEH